MVPDNECGEQKSKRCEYEGQASLSCENENHGEQIECKSADHHKLSDIEIQDF